MAAASSSHLLLLQPTTSTYPARGRLSTFCICNEINTDALLLGLVKTTTQGQATGLRKTLESVGASWRHNMYLNVLHSEAVQPAQLDDDDGLGKVANTREIFFFPYGSIVFWGFKEAEESSVLDGLISEALSENSALAHEPFLDAPPPTAASSGAGSSSILRVRGRVKPARPDHHAKMKGAVGRVDFSYFMFGPASQVTSDACILQSNDPHEKLAISFAFAQSAKLSILEARVDDNTNATRHLPYTLARTGKFGMSQRDISKQIGQLFFLRNSLNLHTDMLDTPEFFWDRHEWEPLYVSTHKLLDVDDRVSVLNRRIDVIHEMLELGSRQSAVRHSARLEWYVIWLFIIDIVIVVVWDMIMKDILGMFAH